ncbi:MAG TPA: M28 family peptidase, partial [Flexilinea sp.]|nr:M28 family peptidase [Flexilinea sp.]
SGVAILLELAERLPKESDKNIWLVFFDGEDQGNIAGWDEWCIGSTMMAQYLEKQDRRPDKVVVIDMVGDKDLQIFREKNSDKALTDEIWSTAEKEGLSNIFQDKEKYSIYDDHIPFLQIGIPAVDLIDFDYPAWHTLADDIQNVSSDSLAAVEQVLYAWLTKK